MALPAQDVFVVESAITNAFQSVNLAMMSIPDKARGDAGKSDSPGRQRVACARHAGRYEQRELAAVSAQGHPPAGRPSCQPTDRPCCTAGPAAAHAAGCGARVSSCAPRGVANAKGHSLGGVDRQRSAARLRSGVGLL